MRAFTALDLLQEAAAREAAEKAAPSLLQLRKIFCCSLCFDVQRSCVLQRRPKRSRLGLLEVQCVPEKADGCSFEAEEVLDESWIDQMEQWLGPAWRLVHVRPTSWNL